MKERLHVNAVLPEHSLFPYTHVYGTKGSFKEAHLRPYSVVVHKQYEPHHEKTCLMPYANNKGIDQPVISTFFVRSLDNIIPVL